MIYLLYYSAWAIIELILHTIALSQLTEKQYKRGSIGYELWHFIGAMILDKPLKTHTQRRSALKLVRAGIVIPPLPLFVRCLIIFSFVLETTVGAVSKILK